jgi:hypothetical protein
MDITPYCVSSKRLALPYTLQWTALGKTCDEYKCKGAHKRVHTYTHVCTSSTNTHSTCTMSHTQTRYTHSYAPGHKHTQTGTHTHAHTPTNTHTHKYTHSHRLPGSEEFALTPATLRRNDTSASSINEWTGGCVSCLGLPELCMAVRWL